VENHIEVVPTRVVSPFLPSLRIGVNPLSVIAEQNPDGAINLMDHLSRRQANTEIEIARASSMTETAKSHCLTIATAMQVRPDKNHFRVTTTDTEGDTGFFFGRCERCFRTITTQLDMW